MDIKKIVEELSLTQTEVEDVTKLLEKEYGIVAAKEQEKHGKYLWSLIERDRVDLLFKKINQL